MADRMGLLLTVEGFSEYKQAALAVQKINDGVAQSMQDVEGASGPAQVSVKKLATAFALGSTAARTFRKGLNMATSMAKKLIVGSTMLAARVEVLGTVLQTVGGNAGYGAEELEKLEKDVKGLGITTQAARQGLIQMAQAQIDLTYATDLSRVAQNAAVIAGINSSQAFQRLVVAIQRGSPLMLRTMGINVSFQRSYEATAKSLNKNTKELTEAEKAQSRINTVLQAGEQIAGAYTDAMEKAGKAMTSIPRYLEEIQLALGEAFQPAFTALIAGVSDALKEVQLWLDENEAEVQELAVSLGILTEAMIDLVAALPSDDLSELVVHLTNLTAALGAGIVTVTKFKREHQELIDVLQAVNKFTAALPVTLAVRGLGKISDALTDTRRGYDKLLAADKRYRTWMEAERGESQMVARARELIDASKAIDGHMVVFLANQERLNRKMALTVGLSEAMEENIEKAAEAMGALQISLQRDLADRLVALERETIRREIQLAREREDIARDNAESVAAAYADAERARRDAAEDTSEAITDFDRDAAKDREKLDLDYARTRIDIETATRRRLEDIQRNFEMSLQDAARSRDAFALVQAQRRAAKERESALTGRQRQLADAETEHTRQRADLQQSLADQRADLQRSLSGRQRDIERQLQESLVSIEQQRQADLSSLAQRDAREREMTALQAAWEEQDRRVRLARQLEDMERQYGVLLGVTAEGLLMQVGEWAAAYGPEGAATRLVKDFSSTVTGEAEKMRRAMVELGNTWLDTMRKVSQVSLAPIPLPPELRLQSPKLGLQVGLEKLQAYLKDQPLNIMAGGAMPATRSSMFSRSESLSRTESSHDVNVNMPNVDAVVASQMTTMFKQVLAS